MLDLEKQALAALPAPKRRRFEFQLNLRNQLARTAAEFACWGIIDAPLLDRHLVLIEDALTGMINDDHRSAALAAEWAVSDAALLHSTGQTEWCSVCRGQQPNLLTAAEQFVGRLPGD